MRDGPSRPKADTGRGLPPNDSCECWPSASDPQPTAPPAETSGMSVAVRESEDPRRGLILPSGAARSREISHPNLRGERAFPSCFRGGPRAAPGAITE